jgi:hypothetical protein
MLAEDIGASNKDIGTTEEDIGEAFKEGIAESKVDIGASKVDIGALKEDLEEKYMLSVGVIEANEVQTLLDEDIQETQKDSST